MGTLCGPLPNETDRFTYWATVPQTFPNFFSLCITLLIKIPRPRVRAGLQQIDPAGFVCLDSAESALAFISRLQ